MASSVLPRRKCVSVTVYSFALRNHTHSTTAVAEPDSPGECAQSTHFLVRLCDGPGPAKPWEEPGGLEGVSAYSRSRGLRPAHSARAPRGGRNAIQKRWPLSTMCDVAGPRRHECSVVNSHVAPFHITCLLKHAAQYGTPPPFQSCGTFQVRKEWEPDRGQQREKGTTKREHKTTWYTPLCVPLRRRLGLRPLHVGSIFTSALGC